MHFNPRAPYGARRATRGMTGAGDIFQSTRPIRGATKNEQEHYERHPISIPAPHTGRDLDLRTTSARTANDFNPRAPYGARLDPVTDESNYEYISIHAPHTGRDTPLLPCATPQKAISIHAPHTGRDNLIRAVTLMVDALFQSTRPIRGATVSQMAGGSDNQISIHAPHTGRDGGGYSCDSVPCVFQSTRPIRGATTSKGSAVGKAIYFNPRAPYGARR